MTGRPRLSGFCNPSWRLGTQQGDASHGRCTMDGCTCSCHVKPPAPDWTQEAGVQEAFDAAEQRRTFDPESLAEWIQSATVTAEALDRAVMGLGGVGWQDAAEMLADLETARKTLARIESTLGTYVARRMREADVKAAPVEGVGFVEWRRGRDRKAWDHERLAGDVLDALMVEHPDGDVPPPWEVRDALLEAAHVDYWRTKVLARLGLDVDDYCETTPGPLSVQITRSG